MSPYLAKYGAAVEWGWTTLLSSQRSFSLCLSLVRFKERSRNIAVKKTQKEKKDPSLCLLCFCAWNMCVILNSMYSRRLGLTVWPCQLPYTQTLIWPYDYLQCRLNVGTVSLVLVRTFETERRDGIVVQHSRLEQAV